MLRVLYNTTKEPKLVDLPEPVDGSWLHLEAPSEEELESLSKRYGLDLDLLHDGVDPNESPRIERDDEVTYIFARYCLPELEKQTTSPLLIIYHRSIVITISRREFTSLEELIQLQQVVTGRRAQLVIQIISVINNGFKQRINRAGRRILQTRAQLDKSLLDNKDFIVFIDIEEDLNDFLLVLEPMTTTLTTMMNGKFMRLYEEDKDLIEDLALSTKELTQLAQSRLNTLRNIREAYSTISANNLNRIFKIMTSITILISIFTLVTGIYSMNISLPAAHNPHAFWIIAAITLVLLAWPTWLFRRAKWL